MSAPMKEVPEKLQDKLYQSCRNAFAPHFDLKDRELNEVAARSIHHARIIQETSTIGIDAAGIIFAALEDEIRGFSPAATCLIAALYKSQIEIPPKLEILTSPIVDLWMQGASIEIDQYTVNSTFRAASAISTMVGRKGPFGLPHLMLAILHEPPAFYEKFLGQVNAGHVARLRGAFVKELFSEIDNLGDITVWRQLVITPPHVLAERNSKPPQPLGQPAQQQIGQTQQKQESQAEKAPLERRPRRAGRRNKQAATPSPAGSPDGSSPTTNPETLPIHSDDPATVDQLGRKAFAKVLANRIVEARRPTSGRDDGGDEDRNRAFVLHLHGPWGSGKSSVLNFVEADLEARDPPWLVVKFDAWRSQRVKPAWWSLMLAVHRAATRAEANIVKRNWLRLRWYYLRAKADLLPALVGLVLVGIGVGLLGNAVIGKADEPLKGLVALLSGIGGIYAFGRSLLFGSASAAQAYADLRSDPYGPMMELFCKLVGVIDKPIVVFIDDLDRCEGDYVCDLLENIQTMLRGASISYLIAADRRWICTSFERRYAEFAEPGGNPGRPLGYQFLDKLFQISADLPLLPAARREEFWNGLLRQAGTTGQDSSDRSDTRAEAKQIAATMTSQSEFKTTMSDHEQRPELQQAIAAEFVSNISTADAIVETEHRLKPLAHLVEPNPRSMKRLANAVAMNQARLALELRYDLEPEEIARWTIIELRWPLLASWLAEDIARLDADAVRQEEGAAMHDLLDDKMVQSVLGGAKDKGCLTPETLAKLLA